MFQISNPQMLSSSFEILTMLLWAFLLWVLFSHSRKPCEKWAWSNKATSVIASESATKWNTQSDDLQLIEWIWPALEKILQKNGVSSYKDIINLDISGLEDLLTSLGGRYASYNPTTWPDQADLAKRKKWSELEEYQEIMKNSKKKSS